MQVFVNECSLNEQYQEYNFLDSLKLFIKTVNLLNQYSNKTLYRSKYFFDYKAIKGMHIDRFLKANNDINNWFNLNLKNVAKWQEQQIHDPSSSYKYLGVDYVGTSIAEITERKIVDSNLNALLVNFVNSTFSNNSSITTIKDNSVNTNISCAFNETSLYKWLISSGIIDPNADYDESLGLPPLDKHTVLLTTDKFEATQWRNGNYGRKVFRLKGTNQLWAVDGSIIHAKDKAHIEVFDENTKKHLGTSIYNKIELNSKFKKNRFINLV